MKERDILADLVHPSRRFNEGSMSTYELVRQTGYLEVYDEISEAGIRDTLARYPECADQWISYSEDKRTTSGWYIKQEEDAYKVGYLSPKGAKEIEIRYANRSDACAAFIKHELEDIRGKK